MKIESFFVGIVVLALSIMLPSCGEIQGPETWAVEIEDYYRAQVALGFDYLFYDKDAVDELAKNLDELAENIYDAHLLDEDVAKYKLALEQMASNNAGAAELLQSYNSIDVKFSEWTKQADQKGFSVWTANEENTGIKVIFKNNVAMEWDVELDEETLVTFMEKVAERYQTQQQSEEWGRGSEVDEDIDVDPVIELIHARICDQYAGRYKDDKIMSRAFYSVFRKAQQAEESEVGWPDWDYWRCTQGAEAKLSSVEIEKDTETSAIAHVVLFYPESDEYKSVDMPMVYENDNWFVDDIICYERNTRFSLKETANKKSN